MADPRRAGDDDLGTQRGQGVLGRRGVERARRAQGDHDARAATRAGRGAQEGRREHEERDVVGQGDDVDLHARRAHRAEHVVRGGQDADPQSHPSPSSG